MDDLLPVQTAQPLTRGELAALAAPLPAQHTLGDPLRRAEVEAALVKAYAAQATHEDAAGFAGISERALYEWLAEGKQAWLDCGGELAGWPPDCRQRILGDLYARCRRSRSRARVGLLGRIAQASAEDWRAAVALLERTGAGYVRRDRLDVQVQEAGDDDLEGLLGRLAEAGLALVPVEADDGSA